MALYSETGELTAIAPFDFHKSLNFIEDFTPAMGEQQVVATASLTKAIMIAGHTVGFRVAEIGKQLRYEIFSENPLPASVSQAAVAQIRFYLSLDDDLTPFYAIGQTDPCFAPIIDSLYGMHHVKFPTLCEIACWAILTQHVAIPIARKTKRALIEALGGKITIDDQDYWAFPDLNRLANVTEEDFTKIIGNERRARFLVEVVKAMRKIDEIWLRTAPIAEVEARLREIPGIGPWSATFILVRGLGRMEQILLDQKPLVKNLPRIYGPNAKMEQIAERYGKWVGYWAIYFRTAT